MIKMDKTKNNCGSWLQVSRVSGAVPLLRVHCSVTGCIAEER